MSCTVTIIGLGPRGLGVLERLVTLAERADAPQTRIEVQVIDPNCTGSGVHSIDQPDYLQMHGPGTDLTMFPDSASLDSEPEYAGPNLFEWAQHQGVLVPERPGSREDRPVRPTDFLPRRVFGKYLSWFLDHLVARAGKRVVISFHRDVAVDAREESDGRITVTCRSGAEVSSDFLLLTIGYGQGSEACSGRAGPLPPFPLPSEVLDIPAGARIAVSGFGLTALDIVSCLTVGRGGTFRTRGVDLAYVPGGLEPQIVMFSRSGVPARARPHRVGVRQEHEPAVLTDDLVRRLRSRGPGTLDFESDLLPFIETEMRVAYWRTYARGAYRHKIDEAVAASDQHGLAQVLNALGSKHGPVDTHALFTGEVGMCRNDAGSYEQWVQEYIAADLDDASRYPHDSPVKAALEAIADAFDTVRAIVARGVLAARSQAAFMDVHGPRLRRITVGPIADRQAELLALMRAGIVSTPLGPDPIVETGPDGVTLRARRLAEPTEIRVAALLPGHVTTPRLDGSGPDLITNLHARGMLRPYGATGSGASTVDVDEHLHPRDRLGRSHPRIWLLGPICEGVSFYTHVLPEPGNRSDCVVDAHRVVTELLASATASR
ncbi:FAD/NAD(P)-binding protein [Streptomyces sp. 7N604]|uniref:FAD/NAD(P)-binding protein n=1 Tax=Streptomyces sp. 7N604 TaxID=3457415 RepID=UPI003FD67317